MCAHALGYSLASRLEGQLPSGIGAEDLLDKHFHSICKGGKDTVWLCSYMFLAASYKVSIKVDRMVHMMVQLKACSVEA